MNPQERLYLITHEIPNHVTALKLACSGVLKSYEPYLADKSRGKKGTRPEGLTAKHLNRIVGNLEQIHAITVKIRAIRDAVSERMPKKTDPKTQEALIRIKRIQEEYANDARLMAEKIREATEGFSENPDTEDEGRTENEPSRTTKMPFSEKELQDISMNLHDHALALLRHKAALDMEFEQAPDAIRKEPGLRGFFKDIRLAVSGIHKSVLASIPRGEKTFDLRDILKEIPSSHPLLQGEKGQKIKVNVSLPPKPIWITGEKNLLTIVYHNLVSNAIKHKHPQKDLEIYIGAYLQGNQVITHVSDNGKGIPDHVLPELFNPTYSGREATDREHDAHGQGLAIVKQAVKLHKGLIEVESNTGRNSGTAFKIRFKLERKRRAG